MEVVRFSSIEDVQMHAAEWDRLATGVPFRSWTWLATWWRHYAAIGQLYVLGVFDQGRLVGVAPWYRATTLQHGRTLRLLGDVEVCSEYETVFCRDGGEHAVAGALAEWLVRAEGRNQWDVIELVTTELGDPLPSLLARYMSRRGCRLDSRPGPGCWRATLPCTWEDYLRSVSKNRRKKIRRMERRYIDSGQAIWHTARTPEQLDVGRELLIDLHQRRRRALGQAGCFQSRRYRAFHEDVLPRLLQQSCLGLHWVEFEGRAIAAEYQLLGADAVYCYQGGIAPESAVLSPGQIAVLFTFKKAIEQGYRVVDFLRGDEPYKQRWQAQFRPTVELRIVASRSAAQWRHGLWSTGLEVKQCLKEALGAMYGH